MSTKFIRVCAGAHLPAPCSGSITRTINKNSIISFIQSARGSFSIREASTSHMVDMATSTCPLLKLIKSVVTDVFGDNVSSFGCELQCFATSATTSIKPELPINALILKYHLA